jgi:glucose-6-phosphate-specific signal transduction histidine kinase
MEANMVFWQRLLITVIVMLAAGFIAGIIWRSIFNLVMPSYLAGFIGGLTALPVWELLKRVKPKENK